MRFLEPATRVVEGRIAPFGGKVWGGTFWGWQSHQNTGNKKPRNQNGHGVLR